jgi:hypothetical protein
MPERGAAQLVGSHLVFDAFCQLDDLVCFFDGCGGQGETVGLIEFRFKFPGELREAPGIFHGLRMPLRYVLRVLLALHLVGNFRIGEVAHNGCRRLVLAFLLVRCGRVPATVMKLEAGRQDGTLKAETSRQQGKRLRCAYEPPLSRGRAGILALV